MVVPVCSVLFCESFTPANMVSEDRVGFTSWGTRGKLYLVYSSVMEVRRSFLRRTGCLIPHRSRRANDHNGFFALIALLHAARLKAVKKESAMLLS